MLASCIFTPSLESSLSLFQKHIWSDDDDAISDELIVKAIQRNEDVDFIKQVLTDGSLKRHDRIKSAKDILHLYQSNDAPSLRQVLSISTLDLKKQNFNVNSIPKSIEERYAQQMEEAIQMWNEYERTKTTTEVEEDEDEEQQMEDQQHQQQQETLIQLLWNRPLTSTTSDWVRCIWYRINVPYMLLQHYQNMFGRDAILEEKIRQFVNAHVQAAAYLDSCEKNGVFDPDLLKTLYTPLPLSRYRDDVDLIECQRQWVSVRKTPLEIISLHFPTYAWTVEQVMEDMEMGFISTPANVLDDYWTPCPQATLETHRIYFACLFILQQCKTCIEQTRDNIPVQDALWCYYVAFTDLFYYGVPNGMSDAYLLTPMGSKQTRLGKMSYSDRLTPWEAYGTHLDVRTFHAGDLPDLYHVICGIPLWGKQRIPASRIGKIYQKSLPFACQRRLLIPLIVKTIEEDQGFWRVFSRLFWVMLACLYPGDLGRRQSTHLGMRDLLRAKELTDDKSLLIDALTADQAGFGKPVPKDAKSVGANGGPLLVFVAVRLHILYMAQLNPQYEETARQCIDWDYFKENTILLADLVRESPLFAQDPFALARLKLSKTVKSPSSKVHRFRRKSKAVCLAEQANETLEKTIIRDKHNRVADVSLMESIRLETNQDERYRRFCQSMEQFQDVVTVQNMDQLIETRLNVNRDAKTFYAKLLNLDCKSRILNLMMKMPPTDRLTIRGFAFMTLSEYGGVSVSSIVSLLKMVATYHDNAAPKKFKACIDEIQLKDFVVICFYLNMAALLEKISFVPLDADTVERTNRAMRTHRYHLHLAKGQQLPMHAYQVCVALCCQKVCTIMGFGKSGAKPVSYDVERRAFVCTHGKALRHDDDDDDDDSDDDNSDDDDEREDNQMDEILNAQNDRVEDVVSSMRFSLSRIADLIGDASEKGGRGKQRTAEMESRKAVRNERKRFNRVPCHQPVLLISLYGRALIWDQRSQIMFCPQCGALHIASIANFSGTPNGLYRCNECAQKETFHTQRITCAYCAKTSPSPLLSTQYKLQIMVTENVHTAHDLFQWMYFCRPHYKLAKRFAHRCPKHLVWALIAKLEREQMLKQAMLMH